MCKYHNLLYTDRNGTRAEHGIGVAAASKRMLSDNIVTASALKASSCLFSVNCNSILQRALL